jgi:hypothetical protein
VDFDRPTPEDFDRFCALMKENGDQPLLIHCAVNSNKENGSNLEITTVFIFFYQLFFVRQQALI